MSGLGCWEGRTVTKDPTPNTQHPSVSVIVLHYGSGEDTRACLASVAASEYPNLRALLIDQTGGRDGVAARVRADRPAVQVVENPRNDGWAGGNNLGARLSKEWATAAAAAPPPRYLLFLNNDATLEPGTVPSLVAAAEADHTLGVLGPALVQTGAPGTLWALGGAIDGRGNARHVAAGEPYATHADGRPRGADYVPGCAMLVRADAFDAVGGFDPRFFLYYEDADFCFRVRAAGWAVRVHPGARACHGGAGGAAGEATQRRRVYYMRRNALLFAERHCPRPGVARACQLRDAARLWLAWKLRGATVRGGTALLARAVGDYFGRRFGPAPGTGAGAAGSI